MSFESSPKPTPRPIQAEGDVSITETKEVPGTDPLVFGALMLCFVVWSYFLYVLPAPDQIWRRPKKGL